MVTSLIQNYNYILAALVLVPVIAYIYSKIKGELKVMDISDELIVLSGFLIGVCTLIIICIVCNSTYDINTSTYYGLYSANTVGIFLTMVIVLIVISTICFRIKCINLLKDKKAFWNAVKKYLPIILMVMFLIWTFISCMLAPSAADDVIGAEAAEKAGASPIEVLAKTLNGCTNLKDGFWAFLMYGSFMLAAILIGKENEKWKKYLIITFTVMMTILSVMTLAMSIYYNSKYELFREKYNEFMQTSGEQGLADFGIQWSDFERKLNWDIYEVNTKWYIFAQRGVFRNPNHFAYVLCMGIIAAMWLAIIEKKWAFKLLYFISFSIQLIMLIVNDTFGGYLGVFVAVFASIIYGIAKLISCLKNGKSFEENQKKENTFELNNLLVSLLVILSIFTMCSLNIKNQNGNAYVVSNVKGFIRDIGVFGEYMTTTENATEVDISSLDTSITKAGSGRGETWIKVWELIKQRPLFGYGLECLLFQFNGQFGIGEGRTHNLLLQLLATVGIPGTLMYFAALAIIFFRLLSNWKSWSDVEKITTFVGISYIVTALTGNSTYYTSPFFMMFLGFVALTQWKKNKSEQ